MSEETQWEPWESVEFYTDCTPEEYARGRASDPTIDLKDLKGRYERGENGRRITMPTYGIIIAELAKRELLK